MKRLLSALTILFVLLLAACSNSDSDGGAEETDTSAEANDEKTEIIVGIDDTFAPMGFRDEDNEIVGFDIDFARAVVEEMDKEITFQPIDWSAKESELNSGRIDLIWNGYTITEERAEKVLFTDPYLENTQVIATLIESEINELTDLAGSDVGVQAQSSAVNALNDSPIRDEIAELHEYKTNVLALQDLSNGRVDAVVIDEVAVDYYMTIEPDKFRLLEESLAPEQYAVGVKQGNEALLEDLQAAIDAVIENGAAAEISEKWFGEEKVLK